MVDVDPSILVTLELNPMPQMNHIEPANEWVDFMNRLSSDEIVEPQR